MMPLLMKEDSGSDVERRSSFAGVEVSQNANLSVGDDQWQGGRRPIGIATLAGGGIRQEELETSPRSSPDRDQYSEEEANGVSGRPSVEVEQAMQSRGEGGASLQPRSEKIQIRDNSLELHEPEQINPQENALEGLARDCPSSGEGRRVYPADVGFPPVFEQRQHHQSNGVGGKAPESEEEVKPSRVVDHRGRGVTTQIEAGLSATQLAFLYSAGEEQKNRMLYQCLKYANDDVTQAKKLCIKLCEFRLAERWDLVIPASELQGPLRSRVHTLTHQRDRLGRAMMTFSPGALDLAKAPIGAYHKMLSYVLQEVLKEDDVPEKGIVLLIDARGVGISMLKNFKVADYRRGLRMLSGAFPVKVKAIRILHLTRSLSMAISTASAFMSAKIRSRLEIVSEDEAADGTFARSLADLSAVPVELSIGGTWTGSQDFWEKWVSNRVYS